MKRYLAGVVMGAALGYGWAAVAPYVISHIEHRRAAAQRTSTR